VAEEQDTDDGQPPCTQRPLHRVKICESKGGWSTFPLCFAASPTLPGQQTVS
jgi:hypothetical protein